MHTDALTSLGFPRAQVVEALRLSHNDHALADEMLSTWKRVPPPHLEQRSTTAKNRASSRHEGGVRPQASDAHRHDQAPTTKRQSAPNGKRQKSPITVAAAGIAEAARWIRGSVALEMNWPLQTEPPTDIKRRDGFEEFFGYSLDNLPASDVIKAAPAARPRERSPDIQIDVHLPDQDVSLRESDVVEAPHVDDCDNPGGIHEAVAAGAQKVWEMLFHMSTIFPDNAGVGCHGGSTAYNKDARRCGEINALLSRGWMPPESVRNLKQELHELQAKVAANQGGHVPSGLSPTQVPKGFHQFSGGCLGPSMQRSQMATQSHHRIAGEFALSGVHHHQHKNLGNFDVGVPHADSRQSAGRPSIEGMSCPPSAAASSSTADASAQAPGTMLPHTTNVPTPEPAPKPEEPKGKGKGKGAPPKAPPAKGPPCKGAPKSGPKGQRSNVRNNAPPFGRRFDWTALSKEKTVGTVFEESSVEIVVDSVCLKNLFEKPKDVHTVAKDAKSTKAVVKEVVIFSSQRAQNMLIALRRQPLTGAVVKALERLDFEAEALGPEVCSVLIGAVPSAEECKQLLGFQGDPASLRTIERVVLPLARIERPAVGQRLRLLLFGGSMTELAADVDNGLHSIRNALDAARKSSALRLVLRHVVCLGSAVNYGATDISNDDVAGFTIESLPKLTQFKATNNSRITLMHILVAQVAAFSDALPRTLLEELAATRAAAKLTIAPFAESVAAFHREASHASACSQTRGGSDGVDEEADATTSHLISLTKRSLAKSGELEKELAATREVAKSTLVFFATSYRLQEVDAKASELISTLSGFVSSFEQCLKELVAHPELARTCHRGATSGKEVATAPLAQDVIGSDLDALQP